MQDARRPTVILLGAGGHAKVCLSVARLLGWTVLGVCDPGLAGSGATQWRDLPVLGDDEALATRHPDEVALINGVGMVPGQSARRRIHERWTASGFDFPALVHPRACLAPAVRLGVGVQVMAGAILQPDVSIGDGTIVNTGVQIDHDGTIGAHVHLAPGTVVCGDVHIGDRAFLGARCVVMPQLSIGQDAVVAAGAVVPSSLPAGSCWAPHRGAAALQRRPDPS